MTVVMRWYVWVMSFGFDKGVDQHLDRSFLLCWEAHLPIPSHWTSSGGVRSGCASDEWRSYWSTSCQHYGPDGCSGQPHSGIGEGGWGFDDNESSVGEELQHLGFEHGEDSNAVSNVSSFIDSLCRISLGTYCCLLGQVGEYATCGAFPQSRAYHCDVVDEPFVTQGEAGSTSSSSLPSLKSPSSSSVESIYYSTPFLSAVPGLSPVSSPLFFPEVVPVNIIEGESTLTPEMHALLSANAQSFGEVVQGEVFEGGFAGVPLLSAEQWYSGGSRGDEVGPSSGGYWVGTQHTWL